MKSTNDKLLDECNDIARELAKNKIKSVVLESEEMLRLLNEKVAYLLKHFSEVPVEVAISYGIWSRESLVALYGPSLFEEKSE